MTFDVEGVDSRVPEVGEASLYPVPVPSPRERALATEVTSLAHDAERGIYRASVEAPGGGSLASVAAEISGGCLIQDDNRFQVTRAAPEDGLVLLLRPVGSAEPIAAACAIEPPPDYSRVDGSVEKLRLLADKEENEEAFGLATGVPIEATRLRDEIPGVGRNAFFYRARAVDPANNRSAWSPTSVPFWQVDTTAPARPEITQLLGGDREATLSWSRDPDPSVTEYWVYRSEDPQALKAPHLGVPQARIPTAPDSANEVAYVDAPLPPPRAGTHYHYRVVAVRRVRAGSESAPLEVASPPSEAARVVVFDTTPPEPPSWLAAEWWDDMAESPATDETLKPKVRLEWETPSADVTCTLFRNIGDDETWVPVSDELSGTPDAATGRWRFRALDQPERADAGNAYRVQARNRFGLVNRAYTEVVVAALGGEP